MRRATGSGSAWTPRGFVEILRGGGTSIDDFFELVYDVDEKVSAPGLRAWALECRWRHWRLKEIL